MQKALLYIKENKFRFNPESSASEFFGLKSYFDMHRAKKERLFSEYMAEKLNCKSYDIEFAKTGFETGKSELVSMFEKLSPDCGCAKMTFGDRCFGGGFHTIGFERHKDTMYVIDSLGQNPYCFSDIAQFHKYVQYLLTLNHKNNGLKKVIFNRKNQQSMTEITCNHWTFANIESLIKALKSGKKIQNSIALDSVLPKDINKVLNEQMNCMSAI